jgi:CRP/FNR family transcriptional regulator, cyclic AMP receptor protein
LRQNRENPEAFGDTLLLAPWASEPLLRWRKRMEPVVALKACPLFRGFTTAGLEILAGIAVERKFATGVVVFAENTVGDSLLVLAQGRVRLTTKNKAGEQAALGEVGPGDYLGELSLIKQGQRMCTATAINPVLAFEIRHADFQRLLGQKPQACVKLLMGIISTFGQKVMDNRENFKALLERG